MISLVNRLRSLWWKWDLLFLLTTLLIKAFVFNILVQWVWRKYVTLNWEKYYFLNKNTQKISHKTKNTVHSQLWNASLIWGLSLALPGVHSNKTWKETEYDSMLLSLQLPVFCGKPSTKDQREMHSKVVWIQWFRKLSSLKYKGAFFVNAALWECS